MKKGGARYNSVYTGERLNHVAFPLGGMGAGMICLEGTGALSHLSVRNKPDILNEPCVFSAVTVNSVARVLEGPVPDWKVFGRPGSGNGAGGTTYGLPRFACASFSARFPFASVVLEDPKVPLEVEITGWSPFIPGDADNSSLPVAALEYRFTNATDHNVKAVYSFNARNFMTTDPHTASVQGVENGFVLRQPGSENKPWEQGSFCAVVAGDGVRVKPWFRGGWYDALTMTWKRIEDGTWIDSRDFDEGPASPGAGIHVPITLSPGEQKTVKLLFSWYVPETDVRHGTDPEEKDGSTCCCDTAREKEKRRPTYKPWYAGRFPDIQAVGEYWLECYDRLHDESMKFSDCFYDSTLPPEVIEAVAANLTILKSPTVLRQTDGRLWCFEGCCDGSGCCAGSCTHVWNYAQALPHLFPDLERSLRQTEFNESQNEQGHQNFRASLPIRPSDHKFHAAADGQLGGIMKVYREWRISGDTVWLRALWPKVKASLDYCIETWDPRHRGVLEEPHHNTYDIEFWGPDGMCTSFYLGALKAAVEMGMALGDESRLYKSLLKAGKKAIEEQLFNGEYFYQDIRWQGLRAANPLEKRDAWLPEALEIAEKEGPKYQYGKGCLSDGVLGAWMAQVCGAGDILSRSKVRRALRSIHKYNFRKDLSEHVNPQRPSFGLGKEGGLLMCTWPKGKKLSLPFPYSNEIWTGCEYHVASHLMMEGMVSRGLDIVRAARNRYDGRIRNPFDEYECGHWYARAMSSYALLQGLTGARYDAVTKALFLKPAIKGDFRCFLATATGYGTAGLKEGKPFVEVKKGHIDITRIEFA